MDYGAYPQHCAKFVDFSSWDCAEHGHGNLHYSHHSGWSCFAGACPAAGKIPSSTFPTTKTHSTPEEFGLAYEEVWFGEGERLHGWFVPGRTDTTILWFHGNGSNLSHPGRVEYIKLLHDRLGVSFFIFDYRGYGRSAGRPSEPGLYQDAQDALAYLRSREDVNLDRIVYYGKSLGGAVASHLATQNPPYRLILESTFTSTPDMARVQFPFLPLCPFLYTRYSNREHLAAIHAPVLIIHGDPR